MRKVLKVLAVVALIIFSDISFVTVNAAELKFQQLRGRIMMPVLPDRVRHRNSRRAPTRIITQPVEIPRYRQEKYPPIYTQRQPKRPSPIVTPNHRRQYPGQRGSNPPKKFNPPRAKYR